MKFDRRGFLAGGGAAAFLALRPHVAEATPQNFVPYLSCGADSRSDYIVAGLDRNGAAIFVRPLPNRGHGVTVHPRGDEAVAFARRPGRFALVLDTADGRTRHRLSSADGRHFYGHGAYSRDGAFLFATENDYEAGDGVLGVYDAARNYERLGEMRSHGIGPHDVRLMPHGKTLAVANGGIRTHPDQGRAKLNIATMAPSLAYVDTESGRLLDRVELPSRLHKLSIRHLDVNAVGSVAFAMQYEGDRRKRIPLVGLHDSDGTVRLLRADAQRERRMRHYVGSVAFDASGKVVAATSPRGHVATFWDVTSGRLLAQVKAVDASGLAATSRDGHFIIAGGNGLIQEVDAQTGTAMPLSTQNSGLRWDNHIGAARRENTSSQS